MATPYVYVAAKDGKFWGFTSPDTEDSQWFKDAVEDGCVISALNSKEEYQAWHSSLAAHPTQQEEEK